MIAHFRTLRKHRDRLRRIPVVSARVPNERGELVETPMFDPMEILKCVLEDKEYADNLLGPVMPTDRIGPPNMSRYALSSPKFGPCKFTLHDEQVHFSSSSKCACP